MQDIDLLPLLLAVSFLGAAAVALVYLGVIGF
jgi:hypothetical protein